MRFRLLLILSVAFAGCGKDGGGNGDPPEETGRLTVELQVPPSPDPTTDVTSFVATVNDGTTVVAQQTFSVGDEISFRGLEAASGLTFTLEGLDSTDTVVSNGTTDPFDLTETFGATVSL